MEKILVALTERNIGSCWLGGTFRRGDFSDSLNMASGYLIPAVIPIGYPAEIRRGAEKVMRLAVKADKRKKWQNLFYSNNFTGTLSPDDFTEEIKELRNAFESVRLGPSASNKQPWQLVLDSRERLLHLFLLEDAGHSGNKVSFSMQWLDAGIAMYHFESVAGENGFIGKWINSNPGIKTPSVELKYIMTYQW